MVNRLNGQPIGAILSDLGVSVIDRQMNGKTDRHGWTFAILESLL